MGPAVTHTPDFDRIVALPRRTPSLAEAQRWASVLTEELVYADARSRFRLRPWQAYALAEVALYGGGFFGLPVGFGKTAISYALPTLLGSRRPMLVIPAALRDKTWQDFAAFLGVLRSPINPIRLVSREELALTRTPPELDAYDPDLVMIDEADDLANPDSAACRVLDRLISRKRSSGAPVVVVAMTGTPGRNSVLNYWHILGWALDGGMPLPLARSEAEMWAAALDNRSRMVRRPSPGPLGADIESARAWYRDRLASTPGVLLIDGDSCTAPITVRVRPAVEDPTLDAAFERFLLDQENPGGIPVSDPLSRWLLDGQLGCGLYSYWDPPPPAAWVAARREAARFARDAIDNSTRSASPLDTEGQVFRRYSAHPTVVRWLSIRDTFKERTKVRWISDSTVRSALGWIQESADPGIVWCGSVEFGRRLAQVAGLMYYGRLGKCESDLCRPGLHSITGDASIVCSWQANKKGFNLQSFGRQLLVFPPQSAKWLEQIFGRSHRSGREGPVVIDVLATSGGTIDAFDAALAEAHFGKATVGLTQKLLRARIVRQAPRITAGNEFRWATRSKQ